MNSRTPPRESAMVMTSHVYMNSTTKYMKREGDSKPSASHSHEKTMTKISTNHPPPKKQPPPAPNNNLSNLILNPSAISSTPNPEAASSIRRPSRVGKGAEQTGMHLTANVYMNSTTKYLKGVTGIDSPPKHTSHSRKQKKSASSSRSPPKERRSLSRKKLRGTTDVDTTVIKQSGMSSGQSRQISAEKGAYDLTGKVYMDSTTKFVKNVSNPYQTPQESIVRKNVPKTPNKSSLSLESKVVPKKYASNSIKQPVNDTSLRSSPPKSQRPRAMTAHKPQQEGAALSRKSTKPRQLKFADKKEPQKLSNPSSGNSRPKSTPRMPRNLNSEPEEQQVSTKRTYGVTEQISTKKTYTVKSQSPPAKRSQQQPAPTLRAGNQLSQKVSPRNIQAAKSADAKSDVVDNNADTPKNTHQPFSRQNKPQRQLKKAADSQSATPSSKPSPLKSSLPIETPVKDGPRPRQASTATSPAKESPRSQIVVKPPVPKGKPFSTIKEQSEDYNSSGTRTYKNKGSRSITVKNDTLEPIQSTHKAYGAVGSQVVQSNSSSSRFSKTQKSEVIAPKKDQTEKSDKHFARNGKEEATEKNGQPQNLPFQRRNSGQKSVKIQAVKSPSPTKEAPKQASPSKPAQPLRSSSPIKQAPKQVSSPKIVEPLRSPSPIRQPLKQAEPQKPVEPLRSPSPPKKSLPAKNPSPQRQPSPKPSVSKQTVKTETTKSAAITLQSSQSPPTTARASIKPETIKAQPVKPSQPTKKIESSRSPPVTKQPVNHQLVKNSLPPQTKAAPITRKPAEAQKQPVERSKPAPIQRKPAEKQANHGQRSPAAVIQRKPAQDVRPEAPSRKLFEKTSAIATNDSKKEKGLTNPVKSPVQKQVVSPISRQVASPNRAAPVQEPLVPQGNPSVFSERTRYQASQASVRAAENKPQVTQAATTPKGPTNSYESSKLKPFSNKSIGSTQMQSQPMRSETSIAPPISSSSQLPGSQRNLIKPTISNTYQQQKGSQKQLNYKSPQSLVDPRGSQKQITYKAPSTVPDFRSQKEIPKRPALNVNSQQETNKEIVTKPTPPRLTINQERAQQKQTVNRAPALQSTQSKPSNTSNTIQKSITAKQANQKSGMPSIPVQADKTREGRLLLYASKVVSQALVSFNLSFSFNQIKKVGFSKMNEKKTDIDLVSGKSGGSVLVFRVINCKLAQHFKSFKQGILIVKALGVLSSLENRKKAEKGPSSSELIKPLEQLCFILKSYQTNRLREPLNRLILGSASPLPKKKSIAKSASISSETRSPSKSVTVNKNYDAIKIAFKKAIEDVEAYNKAVEKKIASIPHESVNQQNKLTRKKTEVLKKISTAKEEAQKLTALGEQLKIQVDALPQEEAIDDSKYLRMVTNIYSDVMADSKEEYTIKQIVANHGIDLYKPGLARDWIAMVRGLQLRAEIAKWEGTQIGTNKVRKQEEHKQGQMLTILRNLASECYIWECVRIRARS